MKTNSPNKADLTPTDYLLKAVYIKYRYVLILAGAILLFGLLNTVFKTPYTHYASAVALALYFVIQMMFKINKRVTEPEEGEFLAPFGGKVLSKTDGKDYVEFNVKKRLFDYIDVRTLSKKDIAKDDAAVISDCRKISWQIESGKINFFETNPAIKSRLAGIILFAAEFKIRINREYIIAMQVGQTLIPGETQVARLRIPIFKGHN